MAHQLKIPLDGNLVSIVRKCGPAIKDVLQSKYECSVDVTGVDSVMGQDFGQSRKPPKAPERRFSIKLKWIEVTVWNADLTSFPVDAVVNAANERLDHCGGLACALSLAGGPDIQRESDKYIKSNGPLKTGEAVVGNPGRLQCRKIIHAVGPCLAPGPSRYEVRMAEPMLETAVRNILAKAEEHNLKSVAIPALSSGLFNFPVEKCAKILAGTLRQYDNARYMSGYPCEIHLVNNDDATSKEMERACREVFGDTTAPVSQGVRSKTSRAKASQTPLTVQVGNIRLTLSKGFIEEQQTEVIVNSTGEDLCLSNGAVSKAILLKAGRKMQEEIEKKYKKQPNNKHQNLPGVLETGPHGLGCKQVYHTLCVVRGVDNAAQILFNAVQECLSLAANQGHKSISFPAIGTGHLAFNKEEVANIMTLAVQDIAKRMATKMDVHFVIYPPEDDTFMAFEAKMTSLQGERSPGSDTGASWGLDEQNTSLAPQLMLSSDCTEANEEAGRWLEDLFRCSGTATVVNNFIQYLGVEELRTLNRDAEPGTSIEEFFERGSAKIKVHAESSGEVIVHVLKAEAMLCAVQKEFVREVKAHMSPSARRSLSDATKSVDFRDRERQFKGQGLHVKKILPVDNTALMEAFELKMKQLDSSAPRSMYQRIPAQFCSMLNDIGFQREFAPPDDPKYGEGIYFAGSVSSAVELWSQQSQQDVYQYYVQALVLTGNSAAGKRDLIMPPPVGDDPLVRYDSLTGGTDISVIFNGHQALPEYIFLCKNESGGTAL